MARLELPTRDRQAVRRSAERSRKNSASISRRSNTLPPISSRLISSGIGLGVVVGGGNILRGAQISEDGLSRPTADAMGMLATVMNALVLEAAIERAGASARTMSALAMPQVCETYERQRALRHLDDGRIIVFAGGTGNPYFTTDTTAVLRAAEMGCDAVLKATDVDGVYTADPKRTRQRPRYERLDHQEAMERKLENHGCDGVRACPGKPYAYHRVFDPGARRDRDRFARKGSLHHRRLTIGMREPTASGRSRRAPWQRPHST